MLRIYVTLSKWFCTADSCIHKSGFINSVSEGSKIWVLNWQLLSEGEVSNTNYFGQRKVLPGVHAALSYIRAFSCHSQMCQGLSSIKATRFGDLNLFWNFLTSKHGCQDGKSFLPLNSCSNMVLHCTVFARPLKNCRQEEFHHVHNTWWWYVKSMTSIMVCPPYICIPASYISNKITGL
jgi:hypothetical protein